MVFELPGLKEKMSHGKSDPFFDLRQKFIYKLGAKIPENMSQAKVVFAARLRMI